ncbi:MAG TPA: hypothetical protein VJS11_12960, partial [Acidobacteriaceae bacterium]|nr:hypothetical protein [Acidobacteriaceae bacterium]
MNPLVRRSLASGAGLALAFCGGAWGIAQTPSSTPSQAPPAQTQPSSPAQSQQTSPAQNPTQPQTTPGAAQNPTPAEQTAPAQPQTRTLQMVEVKAELQKTLDAKKAKQGEPVTAKLQDDANIPNQQMLPKNTVLEGHIDQTQVSPDKKGTSSVTVTFDKAKLKSGQELPIKATVVALQQPQNNMVPAGGGAPSGAPTESPSAGAPGGAAPGGGSAGPSGGGAPMPSQQMPNDTGAASSAQGGQVPGIQLKSDIHQQSSATFLAPGKNVHIPDGTQMEVALT